MMLQLLWLFVVDTARRRIRSPTLLAIQNIWIRHTGFLFGKEKAPAFTGASHELCSCNLANYSIALLRDILKYSGHFYALFRRFCCAFWNLWKKIIF